MSAITVILMVMSNWWNCCTMYEFEGVYDPSYLNLDPNNLDDWKIYAEKVRDLMAQVLDVPKAPMDWNEVKALGIKLSQIKANRRGR